MKVKAVRLYGKKEVRFEEFELREIASDEILASVVTDSLCMSSYKAMLQGSDHRCIPDDIAKKPIILGHELCGRIEKVGADVEGDYKPGDLFTVQAKMYFGETITSPGYSYEWYGGNATKIIIPAEVIQGGYIIPFGGDACYKTSMAEPFSCIISALRSHYHLAENNKDHIMGIKEGGNFAILAGCGPMGLGAAELLMSMEKRPKRIVITDVDEQRVLKARQILKEKNGVKLEIVNVAGIDAPEKLLNELVSCEGYDDILIMAPVQSVIETADKISGVDSCLNFFAGPTTKEFYANINFYDVHYNYKHIIGTSGGDIEDMKEALRLIEQNDVNAAIMVSHVGGLDCAAEATLNLPNIPGAKKLIYCGIKMPLIAIDELADATENELFVQLGKLCKRHNMLWNEEAERYLLEHGEKL